MATHPRPEYECGDPWIDDGNVVLLVDQSNIAFKVHRGILARQSDIFDDMFQLPPPAAEDDLETIDGCQVVRMYDLPVDLSALIKTLYDGAEFQNRNALDFCHVAGILRLSTKYFIEHLRLKAVRFLTETWSCTLKGHDKMLELALQSPTVDGLSYPYVHPLHVLNLARETDVEILVPSALYFLSFYPLSDILRADHPKLKIDHPSRPSSELSPRDVQAYTLMFQHRIDLIMDFVRRVVGQRASSEGCQNDQGLCSKAFSRVSTTLSRAWLIRTGALHFMMQAVDELFNDSTICTVCRRAFRNDVYKERKKFWDGLPGVVGLPTWQNLETRDLESGALGSSRTKKPSRKVVGTPSKTARTVNKGGAGGESDKELAFHSSMKDGRS